MTKVAGPVAEADGGGEVREAVPPSGLKQTPAAGVECSDGARVGGGVDGGGGVVVVVDVVVVGGVVVVLSGVDVVVVVGGVDVGVDGPLVTVPTGSVVMVGPVLPVAAHDEAVASTVAVASSRRRMVGVKGAIAHLLIGFRAGQRTKGARRVQAGATITSSAPPPSKGGQVREWTPGSR
jgi:hypothetical protein